MSILSVQARRVAPLVVFVLLLSTLPDGAYAWSTSKKAFRSQPGKLSRMGPQDASPRHPRITEQKMLRNAGTPPRVRDMNKSSSRLSQSVLASCDTLPSFPTAHGLLSPETVARIEDLAAEGHGSDALVSFVKQYRSKGPLSCVSMLSDPDILPHLTQAMRYVAE